MRKEEETTGITFTQRIRNERVRLSGRENMLLEVSQKVTEKKTGVWPLIDRFHDKKPGTSVQILMEDIPQASLQTLDTVFAKAREYDQPGFNREDIEEYLLSLK